MIISNESSIRLSNSEIFFEPHISVGDKAWEIRTLTIIENQTLVVNRNIFIYNGGALILRNSMIKMNLTYLGEYWIEVFSGGNLTLIGSTITALNRSNRYYIRVHNGSAIHIEDSEISYAGYKSYPELSTSGYGARYLIIVEYGLWIEASKVVIRNSRLLYNQYGIYLEGVKNGVIVGNLISGCGWTGIHLHSSSYNIIANNTIIDNAFEGIALDLSDNNIIEVNLLSDNSCGGIVLLVSRNNVIAKNIIIYSSEKRYKDGIEVGGGYNNTIEDNLLFGCGLYISGNKSTFVNTTIRNTMVNHKPLIYMVGVKNLTIEGDAGQIIVALSKNVTIRNVKIENTNVGIEIVYSNDIRIVNNTIINSEYGILLGRTNSSIIAYNRMLRNYYGIFLRDSNNNTITNNEIRGNEWGIYLLGSEDNIIEDNIMKDNQVDIGGGPPPPIFRIINILPYVIPIAACFLLAAIKLFSMWKRKRSPETLKLL